MICSRAQLPKITPVTLRYELCLMALNYAKLGPDPNLTCTIPSPL